MIPPPGAASSAEMRSLLETRAGGGEPHRRLRPLASPFDRNPRSPLPSAATAPECKAENLCRGAAQGFRGQQRNVVTGGAGVVEIIAPTLLRTIT